MSTAATIDGSYDLGPSDGTLTVHTVRAGMAARAGHDLVIAADAWTASLTIDEAAPERSSMELVVDATALTVREGAGGVKPLSASDRAEILKNIAGKVLRSDRHPQIRFASRAMRSTGSGAMTADGDLTLAGRTQPVQLQITVDTAGSEPVVRASVSLLQTQFGIKPYSAMMGTLRVADEVTIRAEARLPAS